VPDKNIVFIYLKGEKETLRKRLMNRKGHYAGASLLESQFQLLEEPQNALILNIASSPEELVEKIIKKCNLEN